MTAKEEPMRGFKIIICNLLFLFSMQTLVNAELKKDTYTLPKITINLTLTQKAQQKLLDMKESVKILFYLYYNANDQGEMETEQKVTSEEKQFYDKFAQRFLIVPPSNQTFYLSAWTVPFIKKKVFAPVLLVNVVSARMSSDFNLLDCSIYSGDYPRSSNEKINITCKLINE